MQKHKHFSVNGKPFLSIGGQSHNSTALADTDGIRFACHSVRQLGGNTVAIPVSWVRFEPKEDEYDYDSVKMMIDVVRQQELRLIVLWFGAWKNGTMEYAPSWIKRDTSRFPRVVCHDGTVTTVLSQHASVNFDREKASFCKLIQFLSDYDSERSTVIAVQVENEAGIYGGTRRDFSEYGSRDFEAAVPQELIFRADIDGDSTLGKSWRKHGSLREGSWRALFGRFGAEACSAWFLAKYIDGLAAAAKEIFDIFLYTNVWIGGGDQATWDLAGLEYPSGGAVPSALAIWYTACRALDAISPDIYVQEQGNFLSLQKTYANPESGWPLFIPESHFLPTNALMMFHAFSKLGAIGYHIFGSESAVDAEGELIESATAMRRSISMLRVAGYLILKHRDDGRMHGLYQLVGQSSMNVSLAEYKCWVSFDPEASRATGWIALDYRHRCSSQVEQVTRSLDEEGGRGLLFEVSDREFYLIGHKLRIFLQPYEAEDGHIPVTWLNPALQSHAMELISVEEGYFDDGVYKALRQRSGDELRHGIWAQADCGVIHIIMK